MDKSDQMSPKKVETSPNPQKGEDSLPVNMVAVSQVWIAPPAYSAPSSIDIAESRLFLCSKGI
jgi:hypothetical protein